MALTIPAASREYVHIPLSLRAGTPVTPTNVAVALTTGMEPPEEEQWVAAEWSAGQARVLVGPEGALTPDPGSYQLWLTWEAGDEHPVRHVGGIRIT